MEVVAASPSGTSGGIPPFQRRDVEEWSHLDHITGMLEHARVETDHWAANTHNTQHKYGKVVDSRDRCAPDGSQQQRQRRQLEVFQAHVPGGSLQVIRTQTVATSSSRWSSTSTSASASASTGSKATAATIPATQPVLHDFENLQLAINPLDLSSQKTKASVGRSGSIGGRRPPSRPRSIVGRLPDDGSIATDRLQRVSRLCHQLHGETQTSLQKHHQTAPLAKPSILDRQNGDGSVSPDLFHLENNSTSTTTSNSSISNDWKFSSAKRTAPLLKSNKYSSNSDLDTDRRLNTALRGNNVDLEALDQILKSISSTNNYPLRNNVDEPERDIDLSSNSSSSTTENQNSSSSKLNSKRNSFITVESLQEVRGRLRRLSSPVDEYNFNPSKVPPISKEEEPDDGIVAEDSLSSPTSYQKGSNIMPTAEISNTLTSSNTTSGVSRVRSYVYGMEAMLHNGKKPFVGTGSLESRTSNKSNGSSTNRSEDWYNRRKSYGFEQVHNQQIDQSNSISLRGKNKIESSTDSGICRSTEIVVIPSVFKGQHSFNKLSTSENGNAYNKIGNSTVVSLNGDNINKNKNSTTSISDIISDNCTYNKQDSSELFSIWNRRASRNATEERLSNKNDNEQTTITIPIVSDDMSSSNRLINRRMFHRQISDGTSMSIETWPNHKDQQNIKRHSIAVDETKYVSNNRSIDNKYPFSQRRTSVGVAEPLNDYATSNNNDFADDDSSGNSNNKKQHKKVEFCKTEVHFAAESGRVNIVETDDKPPPTQNFRRRRRNSSVASNHVPPEEFNKTGLPLIHFGDTSYEKKLFGVSDTENGTPDTPLPGNKQADALEQDTTSSTNNSNVTVSSVSLNQDFEPDLRDHDIDNNLPRGILKNKMAKPKPYLLGDSNNELLNGDTTSTNSSEEKENSIWGVKLRPVQNKLDQEPANVPIWRSTVTVQNTSYNVPSISVVKEPPLEQQKNHHQAFASIENKPPQEPDTSPRYQPEFQKLLHSLRPARKSEPCFTSPENTFERKSATGITKNQTNYSNSMDLRRSSWSVADRVKQVEDLRSDTNIKGYSTRVNFGSGETTVVENGDLEPIAAKSRPLNEEKRILDEKQTSVLNKGLVVRIGREDSNHTVCSKTTTNHNSKSTTTTTKITIDMSPSPTNLEKFNSIRLPRASLHSLKSTSLVMNMNSFHKFENGVSKSSPLSNGVPSKNPPPTAVPDQLAALKQLYEEAAEHSDDSHRADEEVRSYMSAAGEGSDFRSTEDDVSSVVSGSWSKMTAFKNVERHINNTTVLSTSRFKEPDIFRNIVKTDCTPAKATTEPPHRNTESKIIINFNSNERKPSTSSIESIKGQKRIDNIRQAFEFDKNASYTNGSYLSSPSLVGNSVQQKSSVNAKTVVMLQESKNLSKPTGTCINKLAKDSPSSRRKNVYNQSTFTKRIASEPHKKSDNPTGYFNQKQSPGVVKKLIVKQPKEIKQWKPQQQNKPDLLQQFNESREYVNLTSVIKENKKTNTANKKISSKVPEVKKETKRIPSSKSLTRPDSPSVQRPESPIYENIDDVINDLQAMEKESTMLQELTRAADQILQAVNGYTDEDSKLSTEDSEDDKNKKHRIIKNLRKTGESLSTISETKSWKQAHNTKETAKNAKNIRSRVKPTSSTSSMESITREVQKPVPPVRLNRAFKLNEDKTKKKINDNSELVKITRARRLQRASSREALLQSQGSSSEDISNSIEVLRKPRLVRKTKPFSSLATEEVSNNSSIKKSTISYTTSSLSSKKKEHESRRTSSDRVPVVGLPEIRHKTAVSTIKSTAEKAAYREKAMKAKSEELRKKNLLKRETISSKGSNMLASSQHHAGGGGAAGHRSTGTSSTAREHGVSSSLATVRTSSGVSTKKFTRSEGITKY